MKAAEVGTEGEATLGWVGRDRSMYSKRLQKEKKKKIPGSPSENGRKASRGLLVPATRGFRAAAPGTEISEAGGRTRDPRLQPAPQDEL